MAFSFKKTAAAAMALACTASMCGCMDSGYIGTVDGIQIRNGVYLSCLLTAYNSGYTEVTETRSEAGDTSEVSDLFAETIDGKDAKEWVKEEAFSQLRRYAAVRHLFEEMGLSLTDEDTKEVNDYVNSLWDTEDFYAQYIYGTNTMGEYYDSIGIGKDSMKEIQTFGSMEEKIFHELYEGDAETAVSEEEFNTYIKENYANVKVLEVPYDNYEGLNLQDEAEIQAVKDKANGFAERLNSGESFIEIQYEMDLYNAQNEARVEAEDALETGTAETPEDVDAYIQEAVDAVTVEKKETIEELEQTLNKESDSSGYDMLLTEFIWNLPDDGKAYVYEDEYSSYVVVRDDITTKEAWKEENEHSVHHTLRDEEFEAYLDEAAAAYTVEFDDYLVNTKYAPDKIRGIG